MAENKVKRKQHATGSFESLIKGNMDRQVK